MTLLAKADRALFPGTGTMKASRIHRFGPIESIVFEDIERPIPGPNEVLVRIKAAGVGPWDAWIRAGLSALPQPLPLTLGSDLAGTVEMLGPDVTAFAEGDEVFGVTNHQFTGAYAEFAVATVGMIARKPHRLGHVDAASVPVVAVTAMQALFDHARLQRSQTVLIHGAAGNVGAYAVQMAHRAGIYVFATASLGNNDYVRNLGANDAIDYRASRFESRMPRVDAVIDLVGGETQARSFAVLKRGGALISAVQQPDQDTAEKYGVRASFFLVDVTTERLEQVRAMIEAGELKTNVGTILPLAFARSAHEMLDGARPHPRGKIVLTIGQ